MPAARTVPSTRRSVVPDYAILAAVIAVLTLGGGMMLGIIPLPF
jgi:hypothetical protein